MNLGKDLEGAVFRGVLRDCLNSIPESRRNLQSIHTPFGLCRDIVAKLSEHAPLDEMTFCCLNLEWVEVLVAFFGIPADRIWFVTDCKQKANLAREVRSSRGTMVYNGVHVVCANFLDRRGKMKTDWGVKRRFDCVFMNPPYQAPLKTSGQGRFDLGKGDPENKGNMSRGKALWPKFVEKALDLVREGGYLCAIHPPRWRKPDDKLFRTIGSLDVKYLSINSVKEAEKVFRTGTPFDWYVARKPMPNESQPSRQTTVKDVNGNVHLLSILGWPFLPNCDFDLVSSLLVNDGQEPCQVLCNTWMYHINQPHMNPTKDGRFRHPCIVQANEEGPSCIYSAEKRDFFGISKVIFVETNTSHAIIDMAGEYGLGSAAIGLKVSDFEEATRYKAALASTRFENLLKACLWHQYRVDWLLFKHLKRDFWREFVNEDGSERET